MKKKNDAPFLHTQYQAEILTIGDELLKGSTVNTNAAFLGKELTNLGFRVRSQSACPDTIEDICAKLSEAFSRSDLLILTGGLGPTPDDVTRDALAHYFNSPLIFSKEQYSMIKKLYRRYGKTVPEIVRKEAMFPKDAIPLVNRHGIALGFYFFNDGRLVIVLPGVPMELQKMFFELVVPLAQKNFPLAAARPSLTVKMIGISEPEVMKKLGNDFFDEVFDFGIYPEAGEVSLRLMANKAKIIRKLRRKITLRLKGFIYAFEEISLAQEVARLFIKKRKTLSIAESCTGGLMASILSRNPGASQYLLGGVVAYDNRIKRDILGVSEYLIRDSGAVSENVARAMAESIRKKMNTTFGVGITGIAGPTGATSDKKVGLVFIAVDSNKNSRVIRREFWGDREQVQLKAVKKALEILWREIR